MVLQYLVQALCKLGEADSVQGLYSWVKDGFGKKMPWIKAAVEKAYGRSEIELNNLQLPYVSMLAP